MAFLWTPDPAIGVDMRLDANADLGATSGGDLDIVGNSVPAQNVWQATQLRLLTTLETYLFEDGYGTQLRQHIDSPMTPELLRRIKTHINTTVLTDTRVLRIDALDVTETSSPSGYQVALRFTTRSNQTVGGIITVPGG